MQALSLVDAGLACSVSGATRVAASPASPLHSVCCRPPWASMLAENTVGWAWLPNIVDSKITPRWHRATALHPPARAWLQTPPTTAPHLGFAGDLVFIWSNFLRGAFNLVWIQSIVSLI